jgi:hypothetical protein
MTLPVNPGPDLPGPTPPVPPIDQPDLPPVEPEQEPEPNPADCRMTNRKQIWMRKALSTVATVDLIVRCRFDSYPVDVDGDQYYQEVRLLFASSKAACPPA